MAKNYSSFPNNIDKGDELDIPWFVNENHKDSNAEVDDSSDLDEKIIRMVNTNAYRKRQEAEALQVRQRRAEARQRKLEKEQQKQELFKKRLSRIGLIAVGATLLTLGASYVKENIMYPEATPSGEYYVIPERGGTWGVASKIAHEYNENHPGLFDGELDTRQVVYDIQRLNEDVFDPDGDGVKDGPYAGDSVELPEYND